MIKLDVAHLFVEKYTKDYLLVDFVEEREFIYFRNSGDYLDTMRLDEKYEPTMLLFSHVGKLPLKEGDLFTIPMNLLIEMKYTDQANLYNDNDLEERPMNIYRIFSNGEWISELFKNNQANKCNRLSRNFREHIKETWPYGEPCSLNQLGSNFNLEVVDVGQGSTNLVYDDNTLTVFDCGASMTYPESQCQSILKGIRGLFSSSRTISLIISHWDCDHYNLLTVMDDNLMRQFCCVFVPPKISTLTAKNVIKRLYKNCNYIRTFKPFPRMKKRKVGIHSVIKNHNYELYVGEMCSSINNSGLALAVKGVNDFVILGADHSNYQVWDCIYPQISRGGYSTLNIVVPHHGGDCGKINVKHIAEHPGIAAISVGKNYYKHPQQKTIDEYENLGFEIRRTDWERKNIVIKIQ